MASYSNSKSIHKTLGAGVADVVTISSTEWTKLVVANRAAAGGAFLWVKSGDDAALAAAADGSDFIAPQTELIVDRPGTGTVSVVSTDAIDYSVYGVSASDVVEG